MADNHKPKSPAVRYGFDNPHPLSQPRTELVWEGNRKEPPPFLEVAVLEAEVIYRKGEGRNKYPKPGRYTACVKVVDVFGCDTGIPVEVKI